MSILVAGFSAFPGAPLNPAEMLVRSLTGERLTGGEAIETLVVPVDWDRAFTVIEAAIARTTPRAVLLFGLHVRAMELRLELTARNLRELGREDAAGAFPSGPAVTDGPDTLEARWPVTAMLAALRAERIDVALSRDAGGYLCNDSFYRLCLAAERHGLEAYGFVHTPLTDETVEAYALAGTLPDLSRTLPAEALRRAALALCRAIVVPSA